MENKKFYQNLDQIREWNQNRTFHGMKHNWVFFNLNLTTLFSFQENSWQFCSTITFFQILFIVLFGLFVKYDDDFYKNIESEHDPIAKAQLIAAQVGAFFYGLKWDQLESNYRIMKFKMIF